jgi:glyoxylase-like metal-dependent hydrolase (beta-lactamase superfamily II)
VQGDRIAKGALSYLMASDGEAVVIDAPRRADSLREIVAREKLRVVAVCDTHVHADYVSGGPALAAEVGAPYYLHPADAKSPYDGTLARVSYEPLVAGARIHFGRTGIDVEHTPGHTEGSVTYRVGDALALTGDFVFIASVGRPDLGGQVDAWSGTLFDSLERARASWPAAVRVLPGHYASEAERRADGAVEGPFGELLRTNGPLAIRDREAFRAWIRERAGTFPEAYRRIKHLNLGLDRASDEELEELEAGRNECALS